MGPRAEDEPLIGASRSRDARLPLRLVSDSAQIPEGIAPAVWQVFDSAVARASSAFADGSTASPGRIASEMAMLAEAVRQAASGQEPELGDPDPAVPLVRMLEFVRRWVIDDVRRAEALDADQVLRLLAALGEVQTLLDRASVTRATERLSGLDARELVVEVAHDMRSPLAAILFLVDTFRSGRSGPLSPLQERQLGLIYGAAFGLSQLASDLIDLARGGERLIDRQPIPFSLSELLQSVRDIVEPIAEEKGLTMVTIGPIEDGRLGYPAALNRVLLNLTTNALKYTSRGSVEVSARETMGTTVQISVRDTGSGIPEEVLSVLFQPFRKRRDSESHAFTRAGLGLAICRRLVRLMGSELEVTTGPNRGTQFHFQLDLPLAGRQ